MSTQKKKVSSVKKKAIRVTSDMGPEAIKLHFEISDKIKLSKYEKFNFTGSA